MPGRSLRGPLAPVHDVLGVLRRKLRRTALLRCAGIVGALIAVAALGSFALDWFLDLPLAVRAIHLALVATALVLATAWALRPLRVPLRDEDLAQSIEDVVPDMKDRLASALDFERRLEDPNEPESRELMGVVVKQAAAFAGKLDPSKLVNTRPARFAMLVACAAFGTLFVVAVAAPQAFGLWVRRGVLLQDVDWPRRTHIRVLDFPPEGPLVITRGDDLRIVAVVEGVQPNELRLHYEALEFAGGDGGDDVPQVASRDTRRMFPIAEEPGHYAFDFRQVATSFRFWITGGDDDDHKPLYEVRALVPPRIASIAGTVVYPDYSALPPATVTESSFEVLAGSRVRLELRTNMPVLTARLVPTEAAPRSVPVGGDGDRIQLDLEVFETQEFQLELTARTGQKNRAEDDRFLIRAVADEAPDVRVLFPLARLYRTAVGIVPVKAVLQDDFGVSLAVLELHQDGNVLASIPLTDAQPADPAEAAEPRKRIDVYQPLELADFQQGDGQALAPGDLVRLGLRATDNNGNQTESSDVAVEILSREDLERRLGQRQVSLRDQLLQLRAHQRRTLGNIRELRTEVGDRAPDAGALDRGRDLQVDQGRVTNELQQFLRGVHRVFDAYVLNRLGSIPTIDRLLPIYHEALRQPSEDSDSVFPASLYDEIVKRKRDRRLYDPEVLGALLDIMDLGDDAAVKLSPSVYDALRAWSGDEAPRPELLEEAERRAVELEARLAEIERRMDRWEDLNEIIELARQIERREHELSQPVIPAPEEDR